jgi:hypothetical protein
MLPLKISSFFDPPAARPPQITPLRPRTPLADSPKLVPAEAVPPDRDRRVLGDRRVQDRREREQALFLDTRVGQARRRSAGRRAEDQEKRNLRMAISIKA